MKPALVMVVAACGPGIGRPEPKTTMADVSGDAASLEKLLVDSVTNGGLWFENADCAAKFQTPGEIKPPEFRAFAACLAGLKLQRSAREDALADVAVMNYAPGFEVEARVVSEVSGPRLTWIGFAARRTAAEVPTITVDALEALRVTGERNGPLEPGVASRLPRTNERAQFTWLKLCVDESGIVTSADPYETTSLDATAAFTAAARAWTFRPFTIQGQPMPVCAMVRPAYPAAAAPTVETLPLPPPPSRIRQRTPIVFATGAVHEYTTGKRINGTGLVVPEDQTKFAIQKSGERRLTSRFRVCLDETGHVESVLPLRSSGYAAYDRRMLAAMWKWIYSPFLVDNQPVPVCTSIVFDTLVVTRAAHKLHKRYAVARASVSDLERGRGGASGRTTCRAERCRAR